MTGEERQEMIVRTRDRLQTLKESYVKNSNTHQRSWLTKKLIEDNILMLEILEGDIDIIAFVS
jgi:hypothetical protein